MNDAFVHQVLAWSWRLVAGSFPNSCGIIRDCNGSPDVVLVPPAAATYISCPEVPMPFSEEETGLRGILFFVRAWPDGHHVQIAG